MSRSAELPRLPGIALIARKIAAAATAAPWRNALELGRYRLLEQVGQGGMAVVWRAVDTQLGRTVAVKVLHPHLHAREEIRRRFDREAHAVARLHHPHILDVYDFSGPAAQPSYLVTEFISGRNLRSFADAHPFDPPELAAAALAPIAEALQHAHAAGVVHRDLKPENVMVRDDGVVKLTDFGIAALLDPDEKFTATGAILGSPAHLAPETIEGKPADPRSDIFSFGTMLYWLSCGELPYQAPSPAALLHKILDGKRKDPRTLRPSIADAQARIIARCLENDPRDRYQNAVELRHDLLAMLADAGIDSPETEVARFVREPDAHAADLRSRLVTRALGAGEAQLVLGKTAPALAAFGRALALDPRNPEARARVDRMKRRERLLKAGRRATVTLLVLGAFAAGGVRLARAARSARSRMLSAVATQGQLERSRLEAEWRARDARLKGAQPSPPPLVADLMPSSPLRPPPRDPQKLLRVKLHTRYTAQVTVDGRFLGENTMFELQLPPGQYRALVHSPCCADYQQTLVVSENHPELYPLRFGNPYPARLKAVNAPSGAQVMIDGAFIGPAADLPDYAMTEPARTVSVTIGDRTLSKTLVAGRVNEIDYAKAAAP